MSLLNEKMTALADAIREKSGATGPLSIDGMIEQVQNIETGGGGLGFEYEYVLY